LNYLLDANTYIQAKNQYYGMDICPAYWDWLDQQFALGKTSSIDMVGRELKAGNDELVSWVKDRPDHFIQNDDDDTQAAYTDVVGFVATGNFNAGSRDSFLAGADPWIIAKAIAINASVVTHESQLNPQTKQVKIPNICQQFSVPCMSTFQFLRELKARFVLASS